jgi:hypothetical protein
MNVLTRQLPPKGEFSMPETETVAPAKASTKPRKVVAKKKPTKRMKTDVRPGSKVARILGLVKRPNGASLEELMKATGWQRHSVHGFLSGTIKNKMGLRLNSIDRKNGERAYRLAS